jgi:sirohydrochlorin ferrochelatase
MTDRVLIACSHGTRSPAGRDVITQFRTALAAARPGLRVEAAQVDVHEPFVAQVVDRLRAEGVPMVVVPLLLSTGFHVKTDIGHAVDSAPDLARAAGPLGPDPSLVRVLQDRLAEAGAEEGDVIVLAAAGSSDPAASDAVDETAAALSLARNGATVVTGYAAAGRPTVAEAVSAARSAHPGASVTIASYLLAPGQFVTRLNEAGADRVTAPLAPHPALVELALRRFDQAG